MKRLFLVLIGAMMLCVCKAQVVTEGESALVYYSPKTTVNVEFTYTVETEEKGMFADFALPMLGISDAVQENRSRYTIQDVRIGTSTSTDYSRPHKIKAEKDFPMLLNISDKGLLKGYNLPKEEMNPQDAKPLKFGCDEHKCTHKCRQPSALPEDVLNAATPLAQAHEAAKQIFRLRETRSYLLNGEVEHAPADGKAMELVLAELDKQEQALTELFIGRKTRKEEHKRVSLEPEKKTMLLFFSAENGFTDSENIDADTISIDIKLQPQRLVKLSDKELKALKKSKLVPSQIVYNLPGNGDVKVSLKGEILAQKTIPVAQIGIDVPLGKELFTGEQLPVIVISEKTGNIVSISK